MPFENDIFISYARLDDESLVEGQRGWISTFHRTLEIRVGQLLGEKPRIFRDPKLHGNDFFADSLLHEHLPKSAVLVSVLSPRYVQSEWCTKELREFCRLSALNGGLRIADKARVFKVMKTPVPREQHPVELAPFLGYKFFEVEEATGRPRELSLGLGAEAERRFLALVDDLAYDICQLLATLRQNGAPGALSVPGASDAPVPASTAPPATVYLAETGADLREEREEVKRDLQRNGYTVLPDRPLPLVRGELEAFVEAALARSSLSVHLVGKSYGVVPDGGVESVVELQDLLAARRSREAGLAQLLWLPPGLTVEDPRQQKLVDRLRSAPSPGSELLAETKSLEDLKSVLHGKLAPRAEPERRTTQSGLKRIYLIFDPADEAAALPLVNHLFDRGFEVLQPVFRGDEALVRQDHEESLCACDAVLLYYGAGGELWLRRKLRELQRAPGLGRTQPFLARGIYLAPPPTAEKDRLRTLEAPLLRQPAEGFTPDVLAPFLAQLASKRQVS